MEEGQGRGERTGMGLERKACEMDRDAPTDAPTEAERTARGGTPCSDELAAGRDAQLSSAHGQEAEAEQNEAEDAQMDPEREARGIEREVGEEEEEKEHKDADRVAKLFLGGLSLEASGETVAEHFSKFGELENVRVPMHKTLAGKSRGFGFVTFKDKGVADRVVCQEHIICGRQVDVKFAARQEATGPGSRPAQQAHRSRGHAAAPARPIYAPHLGAAQQAYTPSAHAPPPQAGGARLQLESSPQRTNSMRVTLQLPSHMQEDRHAAPCGAASTTSSASYVTSTTPSTGSQSCSSSVVTEPADAGAAHKIFVGGLAGGVSSDSLRDYFSGNFGPVVSAMVMMDRETHRSRGFGFVLFEEEGAMHRALAAPNHTLLGKRVEVKPAIPRELIESQPRQGMYLRHTSSRMHGSRHSSGASTPTSGPVSAESFGIYYTHHPEILAYATHPQMYYMCHGMAVPQSSGVSSNPGSPSLAPQQYPLRLHQPTHHAMTFIPPGPAHYAQAHGGAYLDPHVAHHYAIPAQRQEYYATHAQQPQHQQHYPMQAAAFAPFASQAHAAARALQFPQQAAPAAAPLHDAAPSLAQAGDDRSSAPNALPSPTQGLADAQGADETSTSEPDVTLRES